MGRPGHGRHREAPRLPAREGEGGGATVPGEVELLEQLLDARGRRAPDGQFLGDCGRDELVLGVLEDVPGDVAAPPQRTAPDEGLVRLEAPKAGQGGQQRRLARPVDADDPDELAGPHARADPGAAPGHPHPAQRQNRVLGVEGAGALPLAVGLAPVGHAARRGHVLHRGNADARFGGGEGGPGGTGRGLPRSAAARAPPAARGRRPVPGAGALRSRNGVRAQCAGHPHAHRLERRPVADEHLAGGAQSDAPPLRVQCEDLVHPGQNRVQVVVDDDDRGPLARQVGHEVVEPLRPLGVDGGRRLVQDQQGGPHRQGDRDGEALALATGQGPRVLAAQSRHAHCGEGGVGALGDLVAPEAQVLQGELDFGAHAPGHHGRVRVLPHVGDRPSEHVGGRVGHLLPAQRDAARVLGGDGVGHQPAAGAHQRRLPASRRADDRRHPARQLLEGHVVEDPRVPTDVVDGQGLAGDEGVSGHLGRSRRPPC